MDKPRTTPKDFFLWAGAMVALYVSVFAFLGLLFDYLNYAFPNSLQTYNVDPYQSSISYEMASLIVMFPLFIVLMLLIHREIATDATRREIWVRRWALMLTLFIAGLTMAIDLIVLLTTFLSGEALTAAFLFKVALVFLVAAAMFMHFIADFWGYWERYPERAHRVGYGTGLLLVLTILAGFVIVGTPMQARQALFDQQKVSDLQQIQSQIVYYWQQKGALPATLNSLDDSISNYSMPADPQTGKPYTYVVNGVHTFQLCATFNRDSNGAPQPTSGYSVPMPASGIPGAYSGLSSGDNWQHGAGDGCFIRTIDPQLYPVNATTAK
ncbi:MAG TPA: DUF5671 domain-containing protein [Candidatus Paceibacterota bacterium]